MIKEYNRLSKRALGEDCSEDEIKWQQRLAFDIRSHLAFSKKELGLCTRTELEIEWIDPNQKPIA